MIMRNSTVLAAARATHFREAPRYQWINSTYVFLYLYGMQTATPTELEIFQMSIIYSKPKFARKLSLMLIYPMRLPEDLKTEISSALHLHSIISHQRKANKQDLNLICLVQLGTAVLYVLFWNGVLFVASGAAHCFSHLPVNQINPVVRLGVLLGYSIAAPSPLLFISNYKVVGLPLHLHTSPHDEEGFSPAIFPSLFLHWQTFPSGVL